MRGATEAPSWQRRTLILTLTLTRTRARTRALTRARAPTLAQVWLPPIMLVATTSAPDQALALALAPSPLGPSPSLSSQ